MKRNIKLKGRLRNYMYWPMVLTILLAVFNVPVYMINTKSGCVVTVFTVIYFIVVCLSYNYNKPVLVNELISFATQYGSAQKKLLEEFEIPYALLDHDGKILWLNQNFSEVTGKDKTYHKTINGIFPALTKELIQKEERLKKRIYFWEDLGAYAPAWGMVGTLLGLINMMRSMGTDAASIGSGMALALITTLYGSVLANWVCIPISRRMEKNGGQESLVMELTIEGVLSIQAGESPTIIKEKLRAFLEAKEE